MSDKNPTPLERLGTWLDADAINRWALLDSENDGRTAELWIVDLCIGWASAPTLDAAILAALAQAGEDA
jgi:hypothetical protein